MQLRSRARRSGFTLIELLVVIAIIGVLAALILPGIQGARNSARRTECLNNMRNVGVAFQNHVSQKGYLPPSGLWDVTDVANYNSWALNWGAGSPGTGAAGMRYSWVLDLLPYLERSDIYDQWDFRKDSSNALIYGSYYVNNTSKLPNGGNSQLCNNTPVKVVTCPSDPTLIQGRGNLSFVVNGGFAYHWRMNYAPDGSAASGNLLADWTTAGYKKTSDNLRNMGLFSMQTSVPFTSTQTPPQNQPVDQRQLTLESVRDGTTTTVMMSENINVGVGAYWENGTYFSNWACPHPWNTSFFVNGSANACNVVYGNNNVGYQYNRANVRGGLAPPINASGSEGGLNGDLSGANEGQFPYPNSGHAGGVNILMCDGSTRFLPDSVDSKIWSKLVTPNGSRVVRPVDGLLNGAAQEDPAGLGFTQGPINDNY